MSTLLAATFLGGLLFAQGNGAIHGTVTDPSGAAVPGAKVIALLDERGTTRELTTSVSGDFVFPALAIGSYTVTVEASGFRGFRRSGVTLTTEQNVRVDVQLQVGNVSDSVVVTAEAPLIDSRSSVIGTLIDSRRVTDLPLNRHPLCTLRSFRPDV